MINAFLKKYTTSRTVAVTLLLTALSFSAHGYKVKMQGEIVQPSSESAEFATTQNLLSAQKLLLKAASSEHSFVILLYHHVGTDTPRSTSVTPEELEQHMAYLAENHTVISLDTAINGLNNKTPFPERAVVITFDDGYKNILDNGHSILKKYGFEYTIFINPAQIDLLSSQLSWEDVKKMSKEGVTFANHTLDHLHLLDRYPGESNANWRARIKKNISSAEESLIKQLGYSKKWLAYPFGEFDGELKAMLKDMGYVGFGQHSGAVSQLSDMQALPRFPAAGRYAKLDTLRTKINSLAMPVTAVRPLHYVIGAEDVAGEVNIDVSLDDISFSRIACYFGGDSLPITKTEKGFSVDIQTPFYPGRTRVNCTAPSVKQRDRFYWYSMPFFTPKADGTYLN
nr:polysaccharide deacetylase family protein [uncultured Glaciecola sp.]